MPEQPGTINQLIQQVVHHVQSRHPEALDLVFDSLPVNVNEQVLTGTLATIEKDIDTLSWFCGYFAGEINHSEDNHKSRHPIAELAKILIVNGMQPFIDFTPYPGCRLVIANTAKFESLPVSVKSVLQEVFNLVETPDKQMQQINDALMQELVVGGDTQ